MYGQKMTDGTNAKEFKTSRAYHTGDVSFHGQVTVKCNTKATDRTRHRNRPTAYSHRAWEGRRERPRLNLYQRIQPLLQSCRR